MDAILSKLGQDMQLRGLTPKTQARYRSAAADYLRHVGKPADETCEADVREYLLHLRGERGLADTSSNQHLSMLMFLYEVTLGRRMNRRQIPYAKRRGRLPRVLSMDEVASVPGACTSIRQRAFLEIAYSAGLRVSEVAALKVWDIDSAGMRILVRGGKGGKDRFSLLDPQCLATLRRYWAECRPGNPEGWLFPGRGGRRSQHISVRTIQDSFKRALGASGVRPDGATMHTLRHCFATHLLEGGAGLLDIKELMGHASLSSTLVYLHLANMADRVRSPLSALMERRRP